MNMKMTLCGSVRMASLCGATLWLLACVPGAARAEFALTSLADGYSSRSLELGRPFSGSIAQHPTNPDQIFVSAGFFGSVSILAVDLNSGTTSTVATGFGSIGGMAFLNNGDLAITENFSSASIFRARDGNADNDYLDAGEVTELIVPILNPGGSFSGAQVAVAPAGVPGLAAGTLLVQTADGTTNSEILAITNPGTSPAYAPPNAAYYSGFEYNGGLAFTPEGHVVAGISEFPTGRVVRLVDGNSDGQIEPGEVDQVAGAAQVTDGIADLAVTADRRVLYGGNASGFGAGDAQVLSIALPAVPFQAAPNPTLFAQTTGAYVSAVRLADPAKVFTPGAAINRTRLYLGGYNADFSQATNLVIVEPAAAPSSVRDWDCY